MSLDLDIADQSFNYTYNVAPMWYKIFPDDEGMVQIEGLTGLQAAEKIYTALQELCSRAEEMRKLSPPNHWGSYGGFIDWLCEILTACFEHPTETWEAFR